MDKFGSQTLLLAIFIDIPVHRGIYQLSMGYLILNVPLKKQPYDDQVVIDKIKSGDENELASIYKEHRSEFLFWVTKNYRCNLEEAKDAYQFSILAFYENVANNKLVHLRSSIKTYLFAIGKNKILEKKKTDSRYDRDYDEVDLVMEEASEEVVEKERHLKLVEKCLEKLGDPCRSMLELYYHNKMSMEEITTTLNYKNANTAKNLKYKCMNRLKRLFEEENAKSQGYE